jgi:hypothetical protein
VEQPDKSKTKPTIIIFFTLTFSDPKVLLF